MRGEVMSQCRPSRGGSRRIGISPHNAFDAFSRRYGPRIDAGIHAFFERARSHPPFPEAVDWYAILEEYCTRGGKRLRPLILCVSYHGYRRGRERDVAPFAVALELMHSMFLIQDDIIDRAALRRGGEALHLTWGKRADAGKGEAVALTMGDILMSGILDILARSRVDYPSQQRFTALLSSTMAMTASGQVLDILHSSIGDVGDAEKIALQIATMKTAHYTMSSPMIMGRALAGGAAGSEDDRIRSFAVPLGVAFQIRDDILGVFGREETTGKPADSDLAEGKLTLLVSGAMQRLLGSDRARFMKIISRPNKTPRDIHEARRMIRESGSLDAARDRHRMLIEDSRRRLRALRIAEDSRAFFAGLIDMIESIPISI